MVLINYKSTNYKTLEDGQRVEFSIENGAKGPSAVNVVVMMY